MIVFHRQLARYQIQRVRIYLIVWISFDIWVFIKEFYRISIYICIYNYIQYELQVIYFKFGIQKFYRYSSMGNTCCQTSVDQHQLGPILPHFKDYNEVEWLSDDPKINSLKQNLILQQSTNQKYTLMKHIEEDRYFVGSWDTDGFPTGNGYIYEPGRMFLHGNFVSGFLEGTGKLEFIAKKCQYQGEFKEGKANGQGIFRDFCRQYEINGQWLDSRLQSGTITLQNDKNMISIHTKDFNKQKAIIQYKDQRSYSGQIDWKQILPHGFGIVEFPLTDKKKDMYKGQWMMGQMHGHGKMVWRDGSYYEGCYICGKKDGFGRFRFPSGLFYEGYWVDGRQQGAGRYIDQQGQQQRKGLYENGKFISPLQTDSFAFQRKKDEQSHQLKIQKFKKTSSLIQSPSKILEMDDKISGSGSQIKQQELQNKEDARNLQALQYKKKQYNP